MVKSAQEANVSPTLREIGGRISKLSYRDMQALAATMISHGFHIPQSGSQQALVADALLKVADNLGEA